ncbi:hypothetical protein GGQ97_000740 [Sphingomonas kaistensis]|uniref:Uncharacterized protein n=1 Tax=Sphingomonas kaistensis TaxID=298708 RepID=A0A7X5Y4B5_9SPHN|nr:hypothetical protein [Sphingomonas kaistensis]NJC04947.1 hypothetical protein [Sphingomonas kaistensis]
MRALVILVALPLLGAASPAPVRPAAPMPVSNPYADERCPETPMSLARKQGEQLGPRKLGDLPTAQTFMAVDRRVAGCAVPITMGELRR